MIGDAVVGPVVGADLLVDVALTHLLLLEFVLLVALGVLKDLVKLLLQVFQCARLVLVLVALILALRYHSSWEVGGAHRRVSLVDVLAAGARRAVSVNADVLLIDVKFLRDVWQNHNRGCTRMHTALFFSLWYPLHLVHPHLVLQVAVHVSVSRDLEDTELAALIDGEVHTILDLFTSPVLSLAVSLIHGYEVCRKETRFAATCCLSDF